MEAVFVFVKMTAQMPDVAVSIQWSLQSIKHRTVGENRAVQ
jgi:hypothetical protein